MMESSRGEMPESLAEIIRRDLRPVRPVLRPEARAFAMTLLAGIVAVVLLINFGARHDLPTLSSPLFLGMLLARITAGGLLILLAFRDAMPDSRAGTAGVAIACASGAAVLVALPPIYSVMLGVDSTRAQIGPWFCGALVLTAAAVPFIALFWLIARAYPLSPVRAGLLAGLGSGILAEAAQFVACSNARTAHAVIVHGGSALTVAIAGVLCGLAMAILRRRELSSSDNKIFI